MDLRLLPDSLTVCRLPAHFPWPAPSGTGFYCATRTGAELSIVCAADEVPVGADVVAEPNWRALEVVGPLDFSLVGVLASLTSPLAEASVSIFAISTYDTDYVLVRADALPRAIESLLAAGHKLAEQ